MMESIGKAGEVSAKAAASSLERGFDPDARIDTKHASPELKIEKTFDPDARLGSGRGEAEKEVADHKIESRASTDSNEKLGLTDKEKESLKTETGWSDEIVNAISSLEEAQVYKDAGLVEAEINGKKCLVNPNIDMNQKDAFGRTNSERMANGLAPLDKEGKPLELHHIGQHQDSPLAELTQSQHRGKDNYSILHDTKKDSEINRPAFDSERGDHWKARAEGVNHESTIG